MTNFIQDNWRALLISTVIVMGTIAGIAYGIDDVIHTAKMDAQVTITKLEKGQDCTPTLDTDGNYSGDICTDTYDMYLDSNIPRRSISKREFELLREGDRITIHYHLGKHGGIHTFKFERT